jgi:hypothetical protein
LLNLYGIPKPTYRAFELLHALGTEQLLVDGLHETVNAWVIRKGNALTVLLTNHQLPRHPIKKERVTVKLTNAPKPRSVSVERIDSAHADAKATWLEMGVPEHLGAAEVEQLQEASRIVKEPHQWKYKDYFENSRRAAYVQQQYAIRNPKKFVGYGEYCWGITASNGPGPATRRIKGVTRRFNDYHARSIPYGPDDGTLAPWAVVASLPFAPEIVLPTLDNFREKWGEMMSQYGISCSFNPTFPSDSGNHAGWVSNGHFGIDQGPVILMIENYRSGLIWRLMRRCPHIITGLRRAGFAGGWLQSRASSGESENK